MFLEILKVVRLTGNMSSISGGSENDQESTHPNYSEVTTDEPDGSSFDCLPEFPTIKNRLGTNA